MVNLEKETAGKLIRVSGFSDGDIEILKLLAAGYQHKAIKQLLNPELRRLNHRLFNKTSQGYSSPGIYERLGAFSEVAAVVSAIKTGLLDYHEIKVVANGSSPEKNRNLTERQKQLLILRARGLTEKEIGQQLEISRKTVVNHFTQTTSEACANGIYARLGVVSSPSAAIVRALQLGIVKLEEI